jgi:hypothetical protein
MTEPVLFMGDIYSGRVVRYGAILKDAVSGQIVGHLKETGQMASILTDLMCPQFSAALETVNIAGHLATNWQLRGLRKSVDDIQKMLDGLQLTTNIAALASVAGLGVSIAGFALVNKRLNKIDSKLDNVAGEISAVKLMLAELKMGWDAMSTARFSRAVETIVAAEGAETEGRKLQLSNEAASDFSLLRNFYANLLRREGVMTDINLGIPNLHELIARYTFSCLGLLQAEFMTGDLGSYRSRLNIVLEEFPTLVQLNAKKLYMARCDQLPTLALDYDYKNLSKELMFLSKFSNETIARIESYSVELKYLETHSISVADYQNALLQNDTNIVLLPS